MDNSGFSIKFVPRRQKLGDYSPKNTIFVDGLERVAERIMEEGTEASEENVWFRFRQNCYFLEGGSFAAVEESAPRADTRLDISSIEFFNHFLGDLEETIKGYDLPFCEEQVTRT